jgi:hypothetical protein
MEEEQRERLYCRPLEQKPPNFSITWNFAVYPQVHQEVDPIFDSLADLGTVETISSLPQV